MGRGLRYVGAQCGSAHTGLQMNVVSVPDCARVFGRRRSGARPSPAFSWSPSTHYCFACTQDQVANRLEDAGFNIYSTREVFLAIHDQRSSNAHHLEVEAPPQRVHRSDQLQVHHRAAVSSGSLLERWCLAQVMVVAALLVLGIFVVRRRVPGGAMGNQGAHSLQPLE